MLAALGEAAERYAAAVIPWNQLTYATQNELGPAAIGLDAFALYESWQYEQADFPLSRWTADKAVYWCKARSLLSGISRYVPAPLVYVPYLYRDSVDRSDFVAMAVSTGAACHDNPAAARLSGLQECIERDAFMITWMRQLAMPRILWEEDQALSRLYDRYYSGCEIKFHLFEITLDIPVPTVLCVAQGYSRRGPIAVVGCATRSSIREACAKALLEAAQCMSWAHYLLERRKDWRPAADYSNIVEFEDHVRLYLEPDMACHLDFILNTKRSIRLRSEPEAPAGIEHQIDLTLGAIANIGLDVVEVELTTRDLAEAGLHVVKVMVPGLVHLTAHHHLPALASPRYRQVPSKLNLCESDDVRFNPIPHPFP